MVLDDFSYLFPFEKIPSGSRILIYGAGDVGHAYLAQILMTGYCECLAFLDRAYDKCPAAVVPIFPPETVRTANFDYVVIAMKTGVYVESIRKALEGYGVSKDKIVYVGRREYVPVRIEKAVGEKSSPQGMAFQRDGGIPIALRLSAALGDCIVRKKIFDDIVRMEPSCLFDFYVPYAKGYIDAVYGKHPRLNCVVDDAGVLYRANMHRYMVALSAINPRLSVDYWNKAALRKQSKGVYDAMADMVRRIGNYGLSSGAMTQNYIHYARMRYKGLDYYGAYSQFGSLFDAQGNRVEIPMNVDFQEKFARLCLGKYITINYETGISASSQQHFLPKQWPLNSFAEFVRLFSEQYPDVEVVQIGADGLAKIPGADRYLFGESLELVKYVLRNAVLHVDIEGGLVHLATQLGTKCAVLFGPTPVTFFGYPQNINIVSPRCSGCHGLYEDLNHCAKEQAEPECMRGITPVSVMEAIAEHMSKQI